MNTRESSLEILESRIAPATVHSFGFTDVDGDHVVVKLSSAVNFTASINSSLVGLGDQITQIAVTSGSNVNIKVTVTKGPLGDGLVNIGQIAAGGIDLGVVSIPGDLGQVTAGSGGNTPAIASLNLRSFGEGGTTTGATMNGNNTVESDINGSIGSLNLTGNLDGAFLKVTGGIGTVKIGGSLKGESTLQSGLIKTSGGIGPVKLGGSLYGGSGQYSGTIYSGNGIKSLSVGGSVSGSFGDYSGSILSGGLAPLGPVKVLGDLLGGSGTSSGSVLSTGPATGVSIAGSIIGSGGDNSGTILVQNTTGLGPVVIGHDMKGGFGNGAGSIGSAGTIASVKIGGTLLGGNKSATYAGVIESSKAMGPVTIAGALEGTGSTTGMIKSGNTLAKITVGGAVTGIIEAVNNIAAISIGSYFEGDILSTAGGLGSLLVKGYFAGNNASKIFGDIASIVIGGSIEDSTSIESTNGNIGSVKIGGSIEGDSGVQAMGDIKAVSVGHNVNFSGITSNNGNLGSVSIKGDLIGGGVAALRGNIGSLVIGGSVESSLVYAGVLVNSSTPVKIGSIKVAGDWIASSVSAGVKDTLHNGYGNADDALTAKSGVIGSIAISGQILGSAAAGDFFGFDAQNIGSFKVGQNSISVPPNPGSVLLSQTTGGDVAIRLVA